MRNKILFITGVGDLDRGIAAVENYKNTTYGLYGAFAYDI